MHDERTVRTRYSDLPVDDPAVADIVRTLDLAYRAATPPAALAPRIRARARRLAETSPGRAPVDSWAPRWVPRSRASAMRAAGLTTIALVVTGTLALGWATLDGSPTGTAPDRGAIDWDAGAARVRATGLRITTSAGVFTGAEPSRLYRRTTVEDAQHLRLHVQWLEADAGVDLSLGLARDDDSWWVSEVTVKDDAQMGVTTWDGPMFDTPIGSWWQGDIALSNGRADEGVASGASVELRGATVEAFREGAIPRTLTGCTAALVPGTGWPPDRVTDPGPLSPGQPLAGTGIERMSPEEAAALLGSMTLCHLFVYNVDFEPGSSVGASGYGETWCEPPPGRIDGIWYDRAGAVRIGVVDADPTLHTPRPQPDVGWGCEAVERDQLSTRPTPG